MAKNDRILRAAREKMDNAFNEFSGIFSEGDILSDSVYSLLDKSFYDQSEQEPRFWSFPKAQMKTYMQWQRFVNLPTGVIGEEDLYHSNERMQNLICSEHAMDHTLAFLLLRQDKYTNLYIGASAKSGGSQIANQVKENIQMNLPGARLKPVPNAPKGDPGFFDSVDFKLSPFRYFGVITGQPSLRSDDSENPIQTLDRLTSGIVNYDNGLERDYALLAISEPIRDKEVKDLIKRMQNLKSALHEYAAYTETMSRNDSVGKSDSKAFSAQIGTLIMTALGLVGGLPVTAPVGGFIKAVGQGLGLGMSRMHGSTENASLTHGGSREHVNYMVKYCENLLDLAIKRMEKGRNLGFWNTGIYVLGDSPQTVDLVMAELRGIYSGENTFQEPIRVFNFHDSEDVKQYAKNLQLMPMPSDPDRRELIDDAHTISSEMTDDGTWHIFGDIYQKMSTPMNTEELSIVMSLPKKDVPGIHIKKDAVEFATNPPVSKYEARTIEFGEILDMGEETGHKYLLDIDQLNRHGLIVGLNGGGKSVTSKSILNGMIEHKVPFMVIDPVKTDYAFWADKYNQDHADDPGFRPIKIFAPGLKELHGIQTPLSKLSMNPFMPYAAKGAPLNMQGHISSLLGLLNKTMAMGDFLPMLLEEAVVEYLEQETGIEGVTEMASLDADDIEFFPTLSGLVQKDGVVDNILRDRQYSTENTQNFKAAIVTRINSLTRGWKREFFESEISTSPDELFESNVIICLAGVTNNTDKAFFMSLLLQAASEYRLSRYQYDDEYRDTVSNGRKAHGGSYIAHYTVVEEAHRILQVPKYSTSDSDPQAAAAEKFCEMLSEIREPGEGLMIIDQYPSRLIADAIKNTNLKVIHRLQAVDDRESMAGCMSLNEHQSRLLSTLKKGDTVISSEQDESAMWLHIIMK